ncbi:hypothetical protein CAL7716_105740 (plasmid) [Calothrix sp. PCC 7716]|nr:hypothetical protein CAL7716_105740 [Calothrix sp. PCC 7716]
MFKKLVLGISLGILFTLSPAAIGESNSLNHSSNVFNKSSKKAIDVGKISIGNIKLGMKERDIIRILGKPKSRSIKYDDVCYGSYITTWKYNGIEIEGLSTTNNPRQSEVHQIIASSPSYPTEKGVKVGDGISRARKAYSAIISRVNGNNLAYSNDAFGGLVFSSSKQQVIRTIRLLGASC